MLAPGRLRAALADKQPQSAENKPDTVEFGSL
jgi:hypothetical protein